MKNAMPRRATLAGVARAVFVACAVLSLAGCHDYAWHDEFSRPVDRGLNEARVLEHAFTINSEPYAFFVPGELGVISLVAFNPADVSLSYSIAASATVGPVTIAKVDGSHATFSFRPDETPLGQNVVFTISVKGTKNGYTYPDYSFTLPCHYPEGNAYTVTFNLPDPASGALVLSAPTTTVLKSDAPVSIGPATGFDSTGYAFTWYVDGTLQIGATASAFSFDPASWNVGQHIVSLVASRDGSSWSANLRITVEAI